MSWIQMNLDDLKIFFAAVGILFIGGWAGYLFCWGIMRVHG